MRDTCATLESVPSFSLTGRGHDYREHDRGRSTDEVRRQSELGDGGATAQPYRKGEAFEWEQQPGLIGSSRPESSYAPWSPCLSVVCVSRPFCNLRFLVGTRWCYFP